MGFLRVPEQDYQKLKEEMDKVPPDCLVAWVMIRLKQTEATARLDEAKYWRENAMEMDDEEADDEIKEREEAVEKLTGH